MSPSHSLYLAGNDHAMPDHLTIIRTSMKPPASSGYSVERKPPLSGSKSNLPSLRLRYAMHVPNLVLLSHIQTQLVHFTMGGFVILIPATKHLNSSFTSLVDFLSPKPGM